jgi:hypothetical protein
MAPDAVPDTKIDHLARKLAAAEVLDIAVELNGERRDVGRQGSLIIGPAWFLALRGTMLAQNPAGEPFGTPYSVATCSTQVRRRAELRCFPRRLFQDQLLKRQIRGTSPKARVLRLRLFQSLHLIAR